GAARHYARWDISLARSLLGRSRQERRTWRRRPSGNADGVPRTQRRVAFDDRRGAGKIAVRRSCIVKGALEPDRQRCADGAPPPEGADRRRWLLDRWLGR